jgi:Fur family zinc uptake transcriptional regulator
MADAVTLYYNNTMRARYGKPMTQKRIAADRHAGLAAAEQACLRSGARLTPLRKRVLELVLVCGKPVGAYSLLRQLRTDGYGDAPPTVYRALEFLQAQGLVHRIAKSNTFVACSRPQDEHYGLIFVCRQCGGAVELEEQRVLKDIGRCADQLGFRLPKQVFEIEGTCRDCRADA